MILILDVISHSHTSLLSLDRAAADAIKFTVDQSALKKKAPAAINPSSVTKAAHTQPDASPSPSPAPSSTKASSIASFAENMDREAQMAKMVCSLQNKDECLMCGS